MKYLSLGALGWADSVLAVAPALTFWWRFAIFVEVLKREAAAHDREPATWVGI